MALYFLLLLPLRSWHTPPGELEPDESNRGSEEKARTHFGSCRAFDVIHMGDNEISVPFSSQGPPITTVTWKERDTGSYELPAHCPLLKLFIIMRLYCCRSSIILMANLKDPPGVFLRLMQSRRHGPQDFLLLHTMIWDIAHTPLPMEAVSFFHKKGRK